MGCNDNQSFCLTDQTIKGNLEDIINSDSELLEAMKNDKTLDFISTPGRITVNIWNLLEKFFKAAHNYGDYGDRNYPSVQNNKIKNWPTVEQFSSISPEAYNSLIDIIKDSNTLSNFNKVTKNSIILGDYFTDLQNYIENFKIDPNRCNSCNTSCYASYSCNQGCGEVCDYGNQCAGSYSCLQGCSGECSSSEHSCTGCEAGVCNTQGCSCESCQGGYCSSCNIGCYSGYSCSRDL